MNTTLATLAALVTSLACAGALASPIKVGSAAAISGPIAGPVTANLEARDLAAAHVNAQGGLLDGRAYELVRADARCDPDAAIEAARWLVHDERVLAVLGPSCSGAMNALARAVTIPAGVVLVSDSATARSISDLADDDLVFRLAASDDYQGRSLAEVAWAIGYRTVAVTHAPDDYNADLAQVFASAFTGLGGRIGAIHEHTPDKASYRSDLVRLAAGGSDALAVFAYYGSGGITILRNSLENSLFERFLIADGMGQQVVIDQLGADTLRGDIVLSRPATALPGASYEAFASAFQATGGNPKDPFVAQSYDIAFLMALAIEKAGTPDRARIAATLRDVANAPGIPIHPGEWSKAKAAIAAGEAIDYHGASGPVELDENGDVTGSYTLYGVSEEGTWTPLD